MTKIEEAISAVRGEMRHIGLDPVACTSLDAERECLMILDARELTRACGSGRQVNHR